MLPAIGTTILMRTEELKIAVIVTDVKSVYGKTRLQVRPVAGEGSQWIELSRVVVLVGGWLDTKAVKS